MRRKRLSIYRVSEPQKKTLEDAVSFKKKQQDKNIETEGTYIIRGAFKTQLLGFIIYCFICVVANDKNNRIKYSC